MPCKYDHNGMPMGGTIWPPPTIDDLRRLGPGEVHRLRRQRAGDPDAAQETNEIDPADLDEGGDGIVYENNVLEAARIRARIKKEDAA